MTSRGLFVFFAATAIPLSARASLDRPWQQLDNSTIDQAWANFVSPPPEYSAQFTWGWRGLVDRESIVKEQDNKKAHRDNAAIIEPQAGMAHPY